MHKSTPGAVRNLTGWNHGANKLKEATSFKYAVRRLKRRQHFVLREKLACSFASKNFNKFWDDVMVFVIVRSFHLLLLRNLIAS